MELKRLSARFGALDGAELSLHPGLNLLEAPNESGKSTWAAFLRTMLYGIRTNERSKGGSLPDKLHYQPWSGGAMAGEVELRWQGKDITLRRVSPGGSRPMGDAEAVLSGTEERVGVLCGPQPGETLLGVSEPVFRRSAFISGAELGVDADTALEKRILRLVSTGEERSSYTEAEDRLQRWQRRRRWRSGGTLPELERELQSARESLRRLEGENERLSRLRQQQETLLGQQGELEVELRRLERDERHRARQQLLQSYETSRQQAEAARQRLRVLEEQAGTLQVEDIRALRSAARAEEEAAHLLARAAEARRAAEEERNGLPGPEAGKRPGVWSAALLCLGLLCLVGGGLAALLLRSLPLLAAAVPGLALAVLGVVIHRREQLAFQAQQAAAQAALEEAVQALARAAEGEAQAKQALGDAAAETAAARRRLPVAPELDSESAAQAAETLLGQVQAARAGAAQAQALADALPCPEPETEAAPEAPPGAARLSREEAENLYRRVQARLEEVRRELHRGEGLYALLGDPLVLATEEQRLSERRERLEGEYDALELAIQTLKAANAQLQAQFSPQVSELAAAYLGSMTGGRYAGVYFDRELHFSARRPEDVSPRELNFLSQGAKSQVYLAVRLALSALLLPEEEPCPLILDDALLSFDDDRARAALRLLRELAKNRQVILFTCQSREARLLQELETEEAVCN